MKVMIQAVSEANKKFMSQDDFPPEVEMLQPPTELPEGIKIEAVPPPPPSNFSPSPAC